MHRLLQRPLLYATLPSRLSWVAQAPLQVASGLHAAACAVARQYSVAQPSRTVDGALSFPVKQPPSRLTLLFPFSHTDIKVITGGYETVEVKVTRDASLAAGGFEIDYDGSYVAFIEQQPRGEGSQQRHRSILAKIPERYCHVALYSAGKALHTVAAFQICSVWKHNTVTQLVYNNHQLRRQVTQCEKPMSLAWENGNFLPIFSGNVDVASITEASLRVATCSGALKLGKIKASTLDVETAGGSLHCQVATADRVHIKTAGGPIHIGRLVGRHCVLDTQPPDSQGSSHSSKPELDSGKVQVDVAYTESLQVKTGKGSITFAFLDSMNSSASLTSQGGDIAVDGLDGTASLQSNGGNIQVKLQENARDVEAHSCGGSISCRVPPSSGALRATLEPESSVTLGEGVRFEEQNLGGPGILLVGNKALNSTRVARQQSTMDRQGTEQEQQQSALHVENMEASQPAVKLLLDARETASDGASSAGKIFIATETWLDRATAKAKASMRERGKDTSD